MRHQFISQIHVIKQLMPFARLYIHACTCNNCIIWCMWISLQYYTRLITRTGMCHMWIQRTPLVILTMSRLTVIEDFWQVHAINHRFVRFLYTQDFYIADKKKTKGRFDRYVYQELQVYNKDIIDNVYVYLVIN